MNPPRALILTVTLALAAHTAQGQPRLDDTTESAIFLLQQSMNVTRTGRHHTMLLSLRHLGDPDLAPLFSQLVDARSQNLKVHGVLGLAECDPKRQLDLVRLAKISDAPVQAEIVSAAMSGELLSDEQALQLYNWPGLDQGVKVVVATQLISRGKLENRDVLQEALASEHAARRALAGLMLHQLGDPAGMKELEKLSASNQAGKDQIRAMLLETATRAGFERVGPWAMGIATERDVNPNLALGALQTALRFGVVEAGPTWRQRYESASDVAQRMRLALLALRLAAYVPAALYDPMLASDDPLIAAMGRAGQAVASKTDVARHVVNLVQQGHQVANDWAMLYAKRDALPEDSVKILMALILSFDGQKRNSAQLLDDAVTATQVLYGSHTELAPTLLRPILQDKNTHPTLAQGILLGLIRSRSGAPHTVIDGISSLGSPAGDALAIILRAKSDMKLSDEQIKELALVVRGGAGLTPELRLQAAWVYLKRTGQTRLALARALED